MARSVLEMVMEVQIRNSGLPLPSMEYKFHPTRQYRFDFAWPEYLVALEVEGGTYNGGRHVTPKGFENDCTKYNDATCLGWKVLRVTSAMVHDLRAINYLIRMLNSVEPRIISPGKIRKRKKE